MPFDFDLKRQCDHLIDGVQYWGTDQVTTEMRLRLNSDSTFRNLFFQKMNARICPRCNGKGWFWDIHFNKNSDTPGALSSPSLIRGRAKLKQEVTKYLTTRYGDNPLHPDYGIGYQDFIGIKILPGTDVLLQIATKSGLNYLRTLYIQQSLMQAVPASERFSAIDSMEIIYDQDTLTKFYINATLISYDEEKTRIGYEVGLTPQDSMSNYDSKVSSFELLG